MKTITEFSGTVLREAARIRKLHRPARPAKRPEAEQDPAPDAAAPAAEAAHATEAAPPAAEAAPVIYPEMLAADVAARAEVAEKLAIKDDRLARLFEALDSVKDRVDNVRLIRVLQGEDPSPSARKV